MPKTLNLNKMQKPSLRIELADEKHTTIFVMPPTKGEIEAFGEISAKLGGNKLDEAIEMCAKLMSHNIAKIPITAETLADWDIYDIQMFYRTYIDYLLEIKNSKN